MSVYSLLRVILGAIAPCFNYLEKNNQLPPDLYGKLGIKRGLKVSFFWSRDAEGRGSRGNWEL
ncbi:hypothetical protein BWI75_02510 [Gloeocapsopsis sp. AAB1 = 1H9]|uniref:Uncharacterized protein n=1 Tax=Gloeocapsopsis dulcis AAB1 = 1H9 TaxID=1433147 RepID=A0A6N8FQD1_9CHRO|nr:hypothetical protein [Gloeocapsopsis dulcis AAB1 = 1H9]